MIVIDALAQWLLTYAVHSTLLLGLAWLIQHGRSAAPWQESMWRCALILPIVSSLLVTMPAASFRFGADVDGLGAPAIQASPAAIRMPDGGSTYVQPGPTPLVRTFERAEPTASPLRLQIGSTTRVYLVTAWVLGGLLGGAGLVLAAERMRRRRRDWQPLADAHWQRDAQRLAHSLQAPDPQLYSGRGDSPLALLDDSILVPVWAQALVAPRRQALLAHEIAHLARRDPQWRLAARVIERVLWFQPLNRVARVRLEAQAEFMCDALAVDADADPRELAGCLAACALRGIDLTPFAAAIASHPSLLRRRIRQLTEGSLMPSTSNPLLRGAIAIACAGLLYAIPTIELQAQAAAGPRSASSSMSSSSSHAGKQRNVSISTSDEDGEISMKYKSRDDSGTLEVTAEGKVEYTEQEDGIASLGSDGEFEIEDDRDGTERRIVYKPSGNGVQARYYVDGDELPLDAAGHAWLARVIPQILREAAFDVEARVDRLVKRGGTAAVFAEIELIQGSYARRAYLVALNARGPLTSADIDRSLALSFTLDSDFELRTAMSSTIESQNLNSAQRDRIVARMADMDSDFEARQVLMSLTPKLDDSSAPMLLAALKAIESDFERRQVLESLFARKDLTPRLIDIGLDGLEGMESDFEKRNVLTSAASHIGSDQAAMLKFIAATRTIESDFERRQVLTDLLGVGKPDSTVVAAILEAVADMDSDFESRQVLTELAPLVGTDADLRTRFRAITKDMSDFERQQAEDALVKM